MKALIPRCAALFLLMTVALALWHWSSYYLLRPGHASVEAPSVLDLGLQEYGQRARATFVVHNGGRSPLVLEGFRTTCGCLSVEQRAGDGTAPAERVTIEPGGSTELYTGLMVRGDAGERLRETISFLSNDPAHPEMALDVLATVQGRLISVPAQVDIGTVVSGTVLRRRLELRDTGRSKPFVLDDLRTTAPGLADACNVGVGNEPGPDGPFKVGKGVCEIDLTIRVPAAPGPLAAELEVREVGTPVPVLSVPIHGVVVPPFQLAPATLVLPRASGSGFLYEGKSCCRSSGGGAFQLRLKEAPEGFAVDIEKVANADAYIIMVKRASQESLPEGTGTIRLLAEQGDTCALLELPVICWHPR
jgi:hypothetical protein